MSNRSSAVWAVRRAVRLIEAGGAENMAHGYELLVERAIKGDMNALTTIGTFATYNVGIKSLAAACYIVAARGNDAGAQFNLASAWLEGAGLPRDIKKGLALLRKARRNGSLEAVNYLGYCLREGIGGKADAGKGFRLSLDAAEAGVAAAQYDVGVCLLRGMGVLKDAGAGLRWIKKAAKSGDRSAQEWLLRHSARR